MPDLKIKALFSKAQEKQSTIERRTSSPDNSTPEATGISNYLSVFQIGDIFTANSHSKDFREARAEYIIKRLRVMLLFFCIAVPAWIPIDYFTLPSEHFSQIATARIILALSLALLLITSLSRPRHLTSTLLVFLSFIAPCIFYIFSMQLLQTESNQAPLAGYSAMPYLMTTLMGLFPVTLLFGIATLGLIISTYAGLEFWLGTLSSNDSLSTLWILCLLCGIVIWIQSGQLLMLLKLYRESSCDPLTGLINRRVLIKQLDLEAEKKRQQGVDFTILMFDLDRFKRVNDNYGHLMGDKVLKMTAEVLQSNLRDADIIARYGGEEFMAVLPGINLEAGLVTAERLRQAIESIVVLTADEEQIPLTTSIGAIEFQSQESIEQACGRVDELLYLAKEQGRNCVVSGPK